MRPVDLTIYPNRGRNVLLTVGALAFVAGGLWMMGLFGEYTVFGGPNPVFALVGLVAVVFFGLCAGFLIYQIISRRPALVLDADGLLDRASLSAVGRVGWAEITGARALANNAQVIVAIDVRDPEAVLGRQPRLRAAFVRSSAKMTGAVVNIPANGLAEVEPEQLVDAVEEFRAAYGTGAGQR